MHTLLYVFGYTFVGVPMCNLHSVLLKRINYNSVICHNKCNCYFLVNNFSIMKYYYHYYYGSIYIYIYNIKTFFVFGATAQSGP